MRPHWIVAIPRPCICDSVTLGAAVADFFPEAFSFGTQQILDLDRQIG
jgi:hypothetical protein